MNLTIRRLVTLLAVTSMLATAVALFGISAWRSGVFADGVREDLDAMTEQRIQAAVTAVDGVVVTQADALTQRVEADMRVLKQELVDAGGFALGPRKARVRWDAKNQVTGETTSVTLREPRLGRAPLPLVTAKSTRVPVVDETKALVGDTATIFQRINDEGDMLRIATNVTGEGGKRVIGTYIPAKNADGSANKVIESVLAGKPYAGTANVVGSWYITRYEPIEDASGGVVGMLYAGVKENSVATLRDAVVASKVGENGRVIVMGTTGAAKGVVRYSAIKEQEGTNALNVKDSTGRTYVAEAVEKAAALKDGETAQVQFVDDQGRPSRLTVSHYPPLDWTIAVRTTDADFAGPIDRLSEGRRNLLLALVMTSLLVVGLGALLAFRLSRRITRPIVAMRDRMAEIADGDGDLTQRVEENDRDEIGQLGAAFNRFVSKVAHTIATVTTVTRGVGDQSAHLLALTQELEDAAGASAGEAAAAATSSAEVDRSVEGAAAATEQMSASIREISTSASRAAEIGGEAARLAAETETVVSTLGRSSAEIGEVVKAITSIAEQTNLLALNATIEAARAGEAGKGFAVVANEVKDLAQETSTATEDIGHRVETIQADTSRAVAAITRIAGVVRDINSAQETIAAAVEEQSATTSDVAGSIHVAASGVQGIRTAVSAVDTNSRHATVALQNARQSTVELDELVRQLTAELESFKI